MDDEYIDDNVDGDIEILTDDENIDDDDIDLNSDDEYQEQYYRKETKKIPSSNRTTFNRLTKYEKVRVIAYRVTQLEKNKDEKYKNKAPIDIAMQELKDKTIPIIIKRTLSNGKFELWKVNELI